MSESEHSSEDASRNTSTGVSYREAREKIESGHRVGVFYPNDSDPSIWYEQEDGEWVAHHRVGGEERGQDAHQSFQRDGGTGTATFRVLEGSA